MKKNLTLYIGILFTGFVSAQKINDTIIYQYTMANDSTVLNYLDENYVTPEEFIEKYKDSVIKDSVLKEIRKLELPCFGHHGGTFDWYGCGVGFDSVGNVKLNFFTLEENPIYYGRKHRYGFDARLDVVSFNDDRYYKDGKLIRWIKADYLPDDSRLPTQIKIHIYDVNID